MRRGEGGVFVRVLVKKRKYFRSINTVVKVPTARTKHTALQASIALYGLGYLPFRTDPIAALNCRSIVLSPILHPHWKWTAEKIAQSCASALSPNPSRARLLLGMLIVVNLSVNRFANQAML